MNTNEIDVIYDKKGKPLLRLLNNGRIVDFHGNSIGFLSKENIYDYNGVHRGWYKKGIFRDHSGCCVGFGENVKDFNCPALPFKQFKPFSGFIKFEPFRPFESYPPFKPIFLNNWSTENPISIFLL